MSRYVCLALLWLWFPASVLCAPAQDLSARHKKWLDEDVAYILSDTERETFLKLDSDVLRDRFIEMFWMQRDPTPGTQANEFKEEHYRRIAYANLWYGSRRKGDGWRSDRGRIYVLLGEPQERSKFTGQNDIRDTEIWFYDSQKRIRDVPFFRILFYQQSFGQDFVLYSPNHDGPQELAMQIAPTREEALSYLRERAGEEYWQAAQSFIPTEPLGGNWSPESDLLISKIENLRNTLSDSSWAEAFLLSRGRVSARLSFGPMVFRVLHRTLFNLNKQAFVHVGFEFRPEDLHIGRFDDRYHSVFTIRTFVDDLETKREILTRQDHWETEFETQNDEVLARPIGFEQVLSLVPGRYRVLWLLDNEISQRYTFYSLEVEIPGPGLDEPLLTTPLLAKEYRSLDQQAAYEIYPFRVFNLQYQPDVSAQYNRGDDLSVFFEYLFPVGTSPQATGALEFQIALRPQDPSGEPVEFTHVVGEDRITAHGIVFVHRQIPAERLTPGIYHLAVQAKERKSGRITSSAGETFTYRGEETIVRPKPSVLDVRPGRISTEYLLERSRQFEVMDRFGEAIAELEAALEKNPENTVLKERLNALTSKHPLRLP